MAKDKKTNNDLQNIPQKTKYRASEPTENKNDPKRLAVHDALLTPVILLLHDR